MQVANDKRALLMPEQRAGRVQFHGLASKFNQSIRHWQRGLLPVQDHAAARHLHPRE